MCSLERITKNTDYRRVLSLNPTLFYWKEKREKILSEVYTTEGMWRYREGCLITKTNIFCIITAYEITLLPECFQFLCTLNDRMVYILTSKFRKNYNIFFFQLLCYPSEKIIVCAREYLQKYKKQHPISNERKKFKILYLVVIKDGWIWIELQISAASPPFSLTVPDFIFSFSGVSPSVLSGQDNNLWVNEFESWDNQLSVKFGWEKSLDSFYFN